MHRIAGVPTSGQTLADFVAADHHCLTRADVLAHWSVAHLDRTLRTGGVARILPGVYCATPRVHDPVVMGKALNLWAPRGLVSGSLALALYAPNLPAPSTATLVVPHGHHMRKPPWVRLVQRASGAVSSKPRGVLCEIPERALLDAWSHASPPSRSDLLYTALWERVCTWRQLARAADRTPRIAGRRQLERILAWFAKGATSPLEVRARRDVFTGPRFSDLEWQAHVAVASRRPRVDALHRTTKVVVELDGGRFHASNDARQKDANRDVDLAAAGYLTVRFTWQDVVERPEWCRTGLLAVIASRAQHAAST